MPKIGTLGLVIFLTHPHSIDQYLSLDHLGETTARAYVDTSGLAARFEQDAGAAFFDVMRRSGEPRTAQQIKQPVVAAGVPKAAVDRAWKQVQRNLHLSRHIVMKDRTYEWISHELPPSEALSRLAATARSGPDFVRQEYVDTIRDALAQTAPGAGAEMSWTEQKRYEKVQLAAELAAGAEVVAADGGSGPEVAGWLVTELQRQRVRVTARLGTRQSFDPDHFDVLDGARPADGTDVDVVRSGFEYVGGDEVKTLVKPQVHGQ